LQLHVDIMLNSTVPASYLAVIESYQKAPLWVEGRQLDRSHGVFRHVGNGVYSCHKHVVTSIVRHGIFFHHA